MAVFTFSKVLVWDIGSGGTVRYARNQQIKVIDPNTGTTPAGLTQGGVPVTVLTADQQGRVDFSTVDVTTVILESPTGVQDRITSQDAIESAAGYVVSEDAAVSALVSNGASSTRASLETWAGAKNWITQTAGDARWTSVTAGDARWQRDLGVVNVKTYGATGDGVTDDTSAILSAQTVAGDRPLYFPVGTYKCSATLTAQTILGQNRQKTILLHTGTQAIGVPAAGVQTYHRRIENMTIRGTGTGTGLHLDSVAAGHFENLIVDQFTECVWLRSTSGLPQQSLYNVFIDVTVSNAASKGFRIEDISHENRFIACRVNIAPRGFDFASGGRNLVHGCAIENCTDRGVSISDPVPGSNYTRGNIISDTRFEFCTNNITIFAGVGMTGVLHNRFIGGTYVDNGTGTMMLDQTSGAVAAGRYATASRPTAPVAGAMIYDTTLSKPIWWSGAAWKDAAGTTV